MNNIIIKDYLGSNIEFKEENGNVYANGTLMCNAFNKRINNWNQNKETKELITEVSTETGIPASQLITTVKGGLGKQGTWIHEELILDLAQWLNPKFRRWSQKQLATLIREGYVIADNISKEQLEEAKNTISSMAEEIQSLEGTVARFTPIEELVNEDSDVKLDILVKNIVNKGMDKHNSCYRFLVRNKMIIKPNKKNAKYEITDFADRNEYAYMHGQNIYITKRGYDYIIRKYKF